MASFLARLRDTVGEERWETLRNVLEWALRSYVVLLILGVIVGLQVAPVVGDYTTQPVRGTVAVVPIEGGISGSNAASVTERLTRARQDPEIKAVVLQVNSPGGGAPSSEEMYLQVKRTANQMPVVTSVGSMAASGGYYAIAPSDTIFVVPSTLIGSVGVFFTVPQELGPLDGLITSGPNKLSGADLREWYYKTESIRRAFSSAVLTHRGDRMTFGDDELSYAKLYTGAEAVENGMADRHGGLQDAIQHAANRAGLTAYNVKVLDYSGTRTFIVRSNYLRSDADDKELVSPSVFVGQPDSMAAPTVLMLPPSVIRQGIEESGGNLTGVRANGTAVAG